MFKRILFILACCVAILAPAHAVLINEFMALNSTTLTDEDGETSDWIELYNDATNAVDLEGWYLTDKSNDLTQWEFPATNLAAGAYLVVFASGKDRAESGSELHTRFSLKGSGEYLALVRPDGATVESAFTPQFPAQFTDVSYGFGATRATSMLVAAETSCRVLVPTDDSLGSNWTARTDFDDSSWSNGTTGVGYDQDTTYGSLIHTDVSNLMFGIQPAVYIRIPFVVTNPATFERLELNMKYDDGYFAYLNGQEIARRYAPESPAWNAIATNFHPDELALVYETVDLPDGEEYLVAGTNILAILGMNNNPAGSDLLFMPELLGLHKQATPTDQLRYFQTPTPGEGNGVGTEDQGPILSGVCHSPSVPTDTEDLRVTAKIDAGKNPVSEVQLYYRIMFSNEVKVTMLDDGLQDDGIAGNSIYGAIIPATNSAPGQMIRYRVAAVDSASVTSCWPLAEDTADYLGTVVHDPAMTNALPVFFWFVENPAWHRAGDWNNLDWTSASVFYREKFYDNIQVRVRGQTASGWTNPPFKFAFNKGHYFEYATNAPLVEEINLNSIHADKAAVRVLLSYDSYRESGGFYSETFPLRIQQNGQFYSVAHFVEQVDEQSLERNGLDPAGALYKMFNHMTSSVYLVEKKTRTGEPNDDLQRLIYDVSETNTASARFRAVFDQVNIPAAINYLAVSSIIHDRDCFFKNYYLYRDTEGSEEWSILPWDKDLTFGRNWTEAEGVLNDEIAFNDSPLQGTFNHLVGAILDNTRIRNMFVRRYRTLMDQILQAPGTPASNLYYETSIARYVDQVRADYSLHRARWGHPYGTDQTLDQAIGILTNEFLASRRFHLYVTNHVSNGGVIPDAQTNSPAIQFGAIEFRPASGNQDEEYIELINTNAVAVDLSGWTLDGGVTFHFKAGTVLDAFGTMYLSPNVVAFRARSTSPKGGESLFVVGAYSGHLSAWGETLELRDTTGVLVAATSYAGDPSDAQRYLRITEIMYDPRDPPAESPYEDGWFEFIEFMNISSNTLDISGVRFSASIAFAFTNGLTAIGPGERFVLVRSNDVFATRYDTNGIAITGPYGGRLSNNGEELKLEDSCNETILCFRYSDTWYTNTDGHGYSLTIRDPYASIDTWGYSNAWRSSAISDGSPGWDDSGRVDEDADGLPDSWEILHFGGTDAVNGGPADDFDRDGMPNLSEYIADTVPTNGESFLELEIDIAAGLPVVRFLGKATGGLFYEQQQRRFTLESGSRIDVPDWTDIPGFAGITGRNESVAFTNALPLLTNTFFRLSTWLE